VNVIGYQVNLPLGGLICAIVGEAVHSRRLRGEVGGDHALADPGDTDVCPPEAQVRQRAEGAEDGVLDFEFDWARLIVY